MPQGQAAASFPLRRGFGDREQRDTAAGSICWRNAANSDFLPQFSTWKRRLCSDQSLGG